MLWYSLSAPPAPLSDKSQGSETKLGLVYAPGGQRRGQGKLALGTLLGRMWPRLQACGFSLTAQLKPPAPFLQEAGGGMCKGQGSGRGAQAGWRGFEVCGWPVKAHQASMVTRADALWALPTRPPSWVSFLCLLPNTCPSSRPRT